MRSPRPFPIAALERKVAAATDPIARFIQLGNLFEVTLRYLATLTLGCWFTGTEMDDLVGGTMVVSMGGPTPSAAPPTAGWALATPHRLLAGLQRPSLGHWCQILHALPPRLAAANALPIPELAGLSVAEEQPEALVRAWKEIQFFLGRRQETPPRRFSAAGFADLLTAFRNKTKAHGAIQADLAETVNPILAPALAAFLDRLPVLGKYPLGLQGICAPQGGAPQGGSAVANTADGRPPNDLPTGSEARESQGPGSRHLSWGGPPLGNAPADHHPGEEEASRDGHSCVNAPRDRSPGAAPPTSPSLIPSSGEGTPAEGRLVVMLPGTGTHLPLDPAALWHQGEFWFLNGWTGGQNVEFLNYATGRLHRRACEEIDRLFAEPSAGGTTDRSDFPPLEVVTGEVWAQTLDAAVMAQDRHRVCGPVADLPALPLGNQSLQSTLAAIEAADDPDPAGTVIVSRRPWCQARFLLEAVVYDFDLPVPTSAAILRATLDGVLLHLADLAVTTVSLSPLGTEHGGIGPQDFVRLLKEAWHRHRSRLSLVERLVVVAGNPAAATALRQAFDLTQPDHPYK